MPPQVTLTILNYTCIYVYFLKAYTPLTTDKCALFYAHMCMLSYKKYGYVLA